MKKKFLIGLLAFAVAGGGMFAQSWTFNGMVDGGIGMYFFDGDDADSRVAPIARDGANVPFRTQLDARFVNADDNAGLNMRIRTDGASQTRAQLGAYFDFAFGWLSFAEGMVTVYGGRVDNTFFNAQDRMFADDSGEGIGLLTIVRPMENLAIGFGGFSRSDDDAAGDRTAGMMLDEAPQAMGTVHLSYLEPGLFRITAGFRNTNEVAGGTTTIRPAGRSVASQAYLSFSYLGMDGMHAAFTARFQNLEEFSDYGDIRLYATFAHTDLVEDMGLHLGASVGINQSDDADLHLWVWAAVEYQLTDRVVPRLDLHYVMGGEWNGWQRLHTNSIRDGVTFNSDDTFIQIRPSVQFRVAPNAFTELGCVINIDLGDNRTFGPAQRAAPANDSGTNIGAYALVRIVF